MTIAYAGELTVEPPQFSLRVRQMILRSKEIAFDCYGRIRTNHNPWYFSGVATLQPEGHYREEQIDNEDTLTEIYIFKLRSSIEHCDIAGFWYEKIKGGEPVVWKFSGRLEPS